MVDDPPLHLKEEGLAAVSVHGLTKRYGAMTAVKEIDFSVGQGEVFAFLGPNGAGKSTTIKMLCTLAHPTCGRATVAGFDVVSRAKAVRRHIGLVFQEQTLDDQLTAEENLRFHAVLYGVPHAQVARRIARVLDLVALSDRRKDLVSTYSGGMARRLEIARGMLHTPKVLFLDEPTVGLDPQTRALMWEDVMRFRDEEGVTIFLTTHYMDEAEYADRIAIIDYGAVIALDTPDALKASVGADTVELETVDDEAALAALKRGGYTVTLSETGLTVFVADEEAAVGPIVAAVGVSVRTVRAHRPTLDDVFLHFTGREIREQHGQALPMFARAHGARRNSVTMTTTTSATPTEEKTLTDTRISDEIRVVGMVWERELIRYVRTRTRIVSGLVQPVLFLFVLGYGMSGLVGTTGGFNFREFVYPGVVAMSVVMTAMFSAMSIVWDREFGFLREMLVAPVSRVSLVLGKTAGGATVAAAQGTIMLVLAPLVGIHLTVVLVTEVVGLELLMAVAMTTFGVFVASRIQKMESFQVVMQMLLMPMLFLSGALFPLNGLPGWLSVVTRLNPLTYAVAPLRQVVFSAQNMSVAARTRFPTNVTLFGHILPIAGELAVVIVFALAFFVLGFQGLSRTE